MSTHLGKLRDASLLSDRRDGASTLYRASDAMPEAARKLWELVQASVEDGVLASDGARRESVLHARRASGWAESVAGEMERHYSPGRTWEATARGLLGLARLGDVLDAGSGDGTLAELIAPRASSVTCLDRSEKVLDAARARLRRQANVQFEIGDLHALPFPEERFDQVMLFNVLTFADDPAAAIAEAARVLRPAGMLAIVTLKEHAHGAVTSAYGHVHPGFAPAKLRSMLRRAGLAVDACEVTSREKRRPHFEILTAFAHREPAPREPARRRK
ncbi:MAG: class I SAM-dependent methyltransferase [Sandaracinaceae bacterium]|nr:class I SAM-dependent methyltransferase [Sandaracinaceae bacterium]